VPRLLAALAALALLLAAETAAPIPKGPTTPEYFPTKLGARWVVRVTVEEPAKPKRVLEHTEVITAVEEKDGVKLVTVARDGGRPVARYAVSPAGVSRVRQDEVAFDPPLQLLRLPARPGDEWGWDSAVISPFPPARVAGRCRAVGPEWVEVPAARYLAMRVETEYGDGASDHTQVRWYAPGVGLVKEVSRSPRGKTETVLKAFVPAKE
jgi:hypothetical protein